MARSTLSPSARRAVARAANEADTILGVTIELPMAHDVRMEILEDERYEHGIDIPEQMAQYM